MAVIRDRVATGGVDAHIVNRWITSLPFISESVRFPLGPLIEFKTDVFVVVVVQSRREPPGGGAAAAGTAADAASAPGAAERRGAGPARLRRRPAPLRPTGAGGAARRQTQPHSRQLVRHALAGGTRRGRYSTFGFCFCFLSISFSDLLME